MKLTCVNFTNEKKYIREFLKLPSKLYTRKDNMEDRDTVKKLLEGTHPLSKYFQLKKFLVYDGKEAVGRFALTIYPQDDCLYFGFFEVVNNEQVAGLIFDVTKSYAEKNGFKRIVGPVDASFWNKYRLKINFFDLRPYTGEPYNREYYFDLFRLNGFEVAEHYTSNKYPAIDETYVNDRFLAKYNSFIERGYEIFSPDLDEYGKILTELYYILNRLYSDFPVYKPISLEDFVQIFMHYKSILNMDMIKVAYRDGRMLGFFISMPNYHNRVYHTKSLKNIREIIQIKKKPFEYVLLYMGADADHKGLGSALTEAIIEELKNRKLPSIGALARDGKVTQKYADEILEKQYEYVLMGWDVTE